MLVCAPTCTFMPEDCLSGQELWGQSASLHSVRMPSVVHYGSYKYEIMGVSEGQGPKGHFHILCSKVTSVRWNIMKRNQHTLVFNTTSLTIGVF